MASFLGSSYLRMENKVIINKKTKFGKDLIGSFIIFLFLLVSPESLLIGTSSEKIANLISRYSPYICFIFAVIVFFLKRVSVLSSSVLKVSCVLIICFFINTLFSPGDANINNIFFHVALILCGFLVTQWITLSRLLFLYEKSLFFLAEYSIVWFGIAMAFPQIIRKLPLFKNSGGTIFYSAVLANFTKYSMVDSFYLRSFCMFREPGVYQMFLNFALCIYLFSVGKQKKKSLTHIAIYALSIISTTSSTGIFALAVLICAFLIKYNPDNKVLKRLLFIAGMMMTAYVFSGASERLSFAVTKIFDFKYDSTVSRLGSITANFLIWLDYPLFGIGQAEIGKRFAEVLNANVTATHNTNTIMFMFACYGIIIGGLFLVGFISLMCKFSRDVIVRVLLCTFIFILLSGENITNSHYAYIIMMFGFKNDLPYEREIYNNESCSNKRLDNGKPRANYVGHT